MIAGLLRVLAKVFVAAATAALVLTIAGEFLRQLVPEVYHQPLWVTGVLICISSFLGALLVTAFAPGRRRLENMLLVGAAVGGLVYLLFVTGSDCVLVPPSGGRSSRMELKCGDVGGSVMDGHTTR